KKHLIEKIIKEINNKNYKEKIVEGTCNSRCLNDFLKKSFESKLKKSADKASIASDERPVTLSEQVNKASFEAYMRPGYYIDALLDTQNLDDCENVKQQLDQVNISMENISLNGKNYFVIRDINTQEVGNNIRRLT